MIGTSRITGLKGKPLKSELHHWWPRKLSAFWNDKDGKVTRLSWEGKSLRAPSAQFGAITNAHHIKLQGPWAGTIEPLFGDADTHLPHIVRRLASLPCIDADLSWPIENRLLPLEVDRVERERLGEGLASLLIRCPSHRHLLHAMTESIWGRFGGEERKPDSTLTALNMHQQYRQMVESLKSGGTVVLLMSTEGDEFIFGEGYLNTLRGSTIELQYRCLVPLAPNMAVLAFASDRYFAQPPLCTIRLSQAEVRLINEVTQVYSRDYIFYRQREPQLTEHFRSREFRRLQFENFPWLDALMQSVSRFCPR
jgi:hypothetical protein